MADDILASLNPGREVTLKFPNGEHTVKVYPLGVWHLKQYGDTIAKCCADIATKVGPLQGGLLPEIQQTQVGELPVIERTTGGISTNVITAAAPIVIEHLLPIIAECVEGLDLKDRRVPVWALPPIAEAWIVESFGDKEKIRPWIGLVETVLSRLTGQPVNLWDALSESLPDTVTLPAKS
jgi:hypothetical protein